MAQLIVAPHAQADLDDILDYLTREAGDPVARRYGDSFRGAFAFLTEFPRTGAPRPNFGATPRINPLSCFALLTAVSSLTRGNALNGSPRPPAGSPRRRWSRPSPDPAIR